MEKLSMEKIAAVLAEVPDTLRALNEDRNSWMERALEAEERLAKHAMQQRIEKLAADMSAKGIDGGRSFEDRVEMLQKKAEEGKLDVVEQAVAMSPANRPLGSLSDFASSEGSELERFLIGELV